MGNLKKKINNQRLMIITINFFDIHRHCRVWDGSVADNGRTCCGVAVLVGSDVQTDPSCIRFIRP